MKPTLVAYQGQTDGLRYGTLNFSGRVIRNFFWDRLTGRIELYTDDFHGGRKVDDDPGRNALARKALQSREPVREAI